MAPVLQAAPPALSLVPATTPRDMVGALDRYGIEQACIFAARVAGQDAYDLNYRLANRAVADVVSAYPERFFGFARIYTSGFTDCTKELIRCRDEYGFRGLMLNGDWEYVGIGSVEVDPYMALCQAWHWPVFFHTGTYPLTQPGLLVPLARRFPHLTFIAAHLGYDMIDDAITVACICPNVFLETSASATPSMLLDVIRRCGSQKLIAGSGLPYGYPDRLFQTICRLPGLSDDDRESILGGNMRRLLAA